LGTDRKLSGFRYMHDVKILFSIFLGCKNICEERCAFELLD
jgi:hypothetical protein